MTRRLSRSQRQTLAWLGLVLCLPSCATRAREPAPTATSASETSTAETRKPCVSAPSSVPAAPAPADESPPAPAPSPRLPPDVLPGIATELPIAGDRAVRVVHGGPTSTRALVYLHGMCGHPEAVGDWAPLASHYGTLIVLRADVPCGDRPGYKWPTDVALIQRRIDRALAAVAEQRGGLLDQRELVLIGYSQGAHRGERLAEAYPDRYPYLVLGGPPGVADPQRLSKTRAVAILGGEREDTSHMHEGFQRLADAGLKARFFLLPGVGHGAYGPRATQVLGEVFAWLFE